MNRRTNPDNTNATAVAMEVAAEAEAQRVRGAEIVEAILTGVETPAPPPTFRTGDLVRVRLDAPQRRLDENSTSNHAGWRGRVLGRDGGFISVDMSMNNRTGQSGRWHYPPDLLEHFDPTTQSPPPVPFPELNTEDWTPEQQKVHKFLVAATKFKPDGTMRDEASVQMDVDENLDWWELAKWPQGVKAIITFESQDYIIRTGVTDWSMGSNLISISYPRRTNGARLGLIDQIMILIAIGEQFGVLTDGLLYRFNEMIVESRAQVSVMQTRVQNIRLAVSRDGLHIAQWDRDGWYTPSGEPVGTSGWRVIEA